MRTLPEKSKSGTFCEKIDFFDFCPKSRKVGKLPEKSKSATFAKSETF